MDSKIVVSYLAAPYSHPDSAISNARLALVNYVAATLVKDGHTVYSPLTHNSQLSALSGARGTWEQWERHDLAMLQRCDELIVLCLPDWEKSVGVGAETKFAEEHGLFIKLLSPESVLWPAEYQAMLETLRQCTAQ